MPGWKAIFDLALTACGRFWSARAMPPAKSEVIVCKPSLIGNLKRWLLFQLDDRRAGAALVLGGEFEALDVRVVAQGLVDGAAQRARAVAVDDADVRVALQVRLVEEAVDLVARVVRGAADEVEFGVHRVARSEEHTSEL